MNEEIEQTYPRIVIKMSAFAVTNKEMVPIGQQRVVSARQEVLTFDGVSPESLIGEVHLEGAFESLMRSLSKEGSDARREYREAILKELE